MKALGIVFMVVERVAVLLPLFIALVTRSNDAFLFDVTLARAGLTEEYIIAMMTVALVVAVLASVRWLWRTTAVCTVLFAMMKHRADFTVDVPQLRCAGAGGQCVTVVTGANSGIGFAISQALAAQGHVVLLGCRSAGKCDDAKAAIDASASHIVPVPGLDLASLESVSSWAKKLEALRVEKNLGKVDLLVANAGIIAVGKEITRDGLELGWGVNHIGHFALVRWLLKADMLAPKASVLVVSSDTMRLGNFHASLMSDHGEGDLRGEHTVGCDVNSPVCIPPTKTAQLLATGWNWGSYCRSKLANVFYARELARRTDLLATSVHPGMVDTPMSAKAASSFADLISRASEKYLTFMLRPPESSAAIVLQAAGLQQPEASFENGAYFNGRSEQVDRQLLPQIAQDDALAARHWEVSEWLVEQWESSRASAAE
eukprot:TRINITY_DN51717_c0_g3_i1.p1 TRINITY_DN51717_c0_g3~~TRINITY_DN51717_c0_g3_i1.p1  ORF type:complete len:430 (+),score=82.45 TRINITY_DN51717_c0_g3_i1:73-1362(+)